MWQAIIKEGDCDRVFYVLTAGEVAVYSQAEQSIAQPQHSIGCGPRGSCL